MVWYIGGAMSPSTPSSNSSNNINLGAKYNNGIENPVLGELVVVVVC